MIRRKDNFSRDHILTAQFGYRIRCRRSHPTLSRTGALPPLSESGVPKPQTGALREKLRASHITFRYGKVIALKDVCVPIYANKVTAVMGPSGCGKSTLLRIFNRMYDLYHDQHVAGEALLDGENILAPGIVVNILRSRVGMVYQRPTPFSMSVYENVAFGIRLQEKLGQQDMDAHVENALRQAALWEEVKDILPTKRAWPVGRTTAAPLHCPHHRGQAGSDPA